MTVGGPSRFTAPNRQLLREDHVELSSVGVDIGALMPVSGSDDLIKPWLTKD